MLYLKHLLFSHNIMFAINRPYFNLNLLHLFKELASHGNNILRKRRGVCFQPCIYSSSRKDKKENTRYLSCKYFSIWSKSTIFCFITILCLQELLRVCKKTCRRFWLFLIQKKFNSKICTIPLMLCFANFLKVQWNCQNWIFCKALIEMRKFLWASGIMKYFQFLVTKAT